MNDKRFRSPVMPMEPFVERIYLEELSSECAWAISAVERMNEILRDNPGEPSLFFRQAAELLQHAGLASKLLWPSGSSKTTTKERGRARGRHLRNVMRIPGKHVLMDRSLRNHFEHYDERLDDWVVSSPNRVFVNNVIGSRTLFGGNAIRDRDIFKLFDPQTNTLVFRGESFDVQALVNGLVDVRSRAINRLQARYST